MSAQAKRAYVVFWSKLLAGEGEPDPWEQITEIEREAWRVSVDEASAYVIDLFEVYAAGAAMGSPHDARSIRVAANAIREVLGFPTKPVDR